MAEAWGPWIEHDGGPRPVRKGVVVRIVIFGGFEMVGPVGAVHPADTGSGDSWVWDEPSIGSIIRYRIRRPDALLSLIDLAESVEHLRPETIKALVGV